MTKAWTTRPTGYADIDLPQGECVLISDDQRTFWPDMIRVIHNGHLILLYPDALTLDAQFANPPLIGG